MLKIVIYIHSNLLRLKILTNLIEKGLRSWLMRLLYNRNLPDSGPAGIEENVQAVSAS